MSFFLPRVTAESTLRGVSAPSITDVAVRDVPLCGHVWWPWPSSRAGASRPTPALPLDGRAQGSQFAVRSDVQARAGMDPGLSPLRGGHRTDALQARLSQGGRGNYRSQPARNCLTLKAGNTKIENTAYPTRGPNLRAMPESSGLQNPFYKFIVARRRTLQAATGPPS